MPESVYPPRVPVAMSGVELPLWVVCSDGSVWSLGWDGSAEIPVWRRQPSVPDSAAWREDRQRGGR